MNWPFLVWFAGKTPEEHACRTPKVPQSSGKPLGARTCLLIRLKKAVAVSDKKIQERSRRQGRFFQQPFSLPGNAQTLAGIASRAAGKSVKNFPAESKFAGKLFQQGISDSHSLFEVSDLRTSFFLPSFEISASNPIPGKCGKVPLTPRKTRARGGSHGVKMRKMRTPKCGKFGKCSWPLSII